MLIRWRSILIGAAAGLSSTVLLGLIGSLAAGLVGVTDPFSLGIVLGAVLGLLMGGFVAAKFAFDHQPLHGSVAALVTAAVIGIDALLRGSGAAALTLIAYALLASLLGGLGGYIGGRGER